MSYHELTIAIAAPFRDTLIRRLMDAGCLGVIEKDDAITTYIPESIDLRTITTD